jgi:hypothetical protein
VRIVINLAICVLLGACGKPDNAAGPGGVTVGEAKALDQAAEMIEAQRLPPAAVTAPPPAVQSIPQPSAQAAIRQ